MSATRRLRPFLLLITALLVLLPGTGWADTTPAGPSPAVPAPATPAGAGEPVSWQVYPGGDQTGRSHFALTVAPGETVSGTVVIRNLSAVDLRLAVYGADASTGPDGAFALRESGSGELGLFGAWVTPAQTVVDVPASSDVRVPFDVVVPADAPPGDYGGAVLTSWNDSSGETTTVVARVGARLHLQVSGELAPALEVSDPVLLREAAWWNPFSGDVAVSSTVTNTGNTRLSLAGTAAGGSLLGEVDTTLVPADLELWPGDSVEVTGTLAGATSLWSLGATVTVSASVVAEVPVALDPVVVTGGLTVIPWLPLLLLALVLLGVVLLIRSRRARRATADDEPRGEEDRSTAREPERVG